MYIAAALWREENKSAETPAVKLIYRTHAVHKEAPRQSGEAKGATHTLALTCPWIRFHHILVQKTNIALASPVQSPAY